MKRYYNKSVTPHWHCVTLEGHSYEVYTWLQRYDGVGRFYIPSWNFIRNKFYFEYPEDASMFILKWMK